MRMAVLGAGITGMATALMAARRGHAVTLVEREPRRADEGGADDAFLRWPRPRVPQAVQPHSLLGPVRAILRAELPDVYADMLARGAVEYHEFDWFAAHPPYREGDEDLVTLRTRRIVLEAALAAAVRREAGVETRAGEAVTGLELAAGDPPRVTGVRTAAGTICADLVVDASGRRSPVPGLLTAAGCRAPVVESHRTGITYLCRWYRLRDGGPGEPRGQRNGSDSAFAVAGVFPSDNGTFALHLVLSTGDPTRAAFTDPGRFDAACRAFPATAAWLADRPEPLTGVLPMAGLDNRWTSLADADGPVASGLAGAGDSVVHTNPTLGQGIALGLRSARRLATYAEAAAVDPAAHHAWQLRELRPWFDVQVSGDRAGERRLAEVTAPSVRRAAAQAAAFDDPVVMRARARVRHLVVTPDRAFAADEVRARVDAWLAVRPGWTPAHDGPDRAAWEALAAGGAAVSR